MRCADLWKEVRLWRKFSWMKHMLFVWSVRNVFKRIDIHIYIYRDALCLWSLKSCHKTDARKMLATQISSREEYSREAFTKCNCARLLVLFSSRKCFNKVICAFCWICRQQSNSKAISKYGGKRGATEATETRAWETIWECSKTERGTMISLSIYRNLPYWLIFHQHDNT